MEVRSYIAPNIWLKGLFTMKQKQIEKRALTVTVFVNTVITAAGIWMYFLTGLNMMLLDGFFSLLALLSALMAVLISRISRKTTKHYPHGLYFLEPLYAVFKAGMMLCLMGYALVSSSRIAMDYFLHGEGQVMETAPLPAYAVAMTVLCLGLAFFNRRQYKRTNSTSTMLLAESQTNLIDGLQSAGIGAAILILRWIPQDSSLGFLHYTGDFFITLILVVTALKEPVLLLLESFRELTGGVCIDRVMVQTVCEATGLKENQFCIYKTGMRIKVCIPAQNMDQTLLGSKEKMEKALQVTYENASIAFIS